MCVCVCVCVCVRITVVGNRYGNTWTKPFAFYIE